MPEPIKIIIKDETGTEQVQQSVNTDKNVSSLANEQTKANNRKSNLAAAGVYVAMGTANYVTSNIGKWSGDQRIQANIDNAKRLAGYGMALATNVYLGLAVIGVDAATSVANYMYDRQWENIRSSQAKARNGDLGGYRR